MNKNIFGLLITFLGFALIGYFLPVDKFLSGKSDIEDKIIKLEKTDSLESEKMEPVKESQTISEIKDESVSISEPQLSAPKDINARVSRHRRSYDYSIAVSAVIDSADSIECVVRQYENSNNIVASAPMKEGKCLIAKVPASNDGTYYIEVRSTVTNVSSGIVVPGFNKMEKWSKEEVSKHLNSENLPDIFFAHFDSAKLKISCSGDSSIEVPENISLDRLRTARSASNWKLTVTDTPVYDDLNRIVGLKIYITNQN